MRSKHHFRHVARACLGKAVENWPGQHVTAGMSVIASPWLRKKAIAGSVQDGDRHLSRH